MLTMIGAESQPYREDSILLSKEDPQKFKTKLLLSVRFDSFKCQSTCKYIFESYKYLYHIFETRTFVDNNLLLPLTLNFF